MLPIPESAMTRLRFLASTMLTAGVVCFTPQDLFAAPESLVEKTRDSLRRGRSQGFVSSSLFVGLVYQGV